MTSIYLAVIAARIPADILAAAVLTPDAAKFALRDLPARLDPSEICFTCMEKIGSEFCCGTVTPQETVPTSFAWFGAR